MAPVTGEVQPSRIDQAVRRVLLSPPAMAVKRTLRDLAWSLRGRSLKNPPIPPNPRALLFVCLGNICRSPFAAHLAARELQAAGLTAVRCSSAGFRPSQATTSPRTAVAAAARFGVSLTEHRPMLVTADLMAAHDMVFVMEPAQLEMLHRRWPTHASRCFLLTLFDTETPVGAFERYHIVDPFGKDAAAFDYCYRRIDVAVRQLARALTSHD